MGNARSGGNPYDFRSPVRHRALLAGRSEELAQIDEFLREAASGRPVHFSLFGGQGSGKSSLLTVWFVSDLSALAPNLRGRVSELVAMRDTGAVVNSPAVCAL